MVDDDGIGMKGLGESGGSGDIVYGKGILMGKDRVDVFVVDGGSGRGGEGGWGGYGVEVGSELWEGVDCMYCFNSDGKIIVRGDLNDYCDCGGLVLVEDDELVKMSEDGDGGNGGKGSYG